MQELLAKGEAAGRAKLGAEVAEAIRRGETRAELLERLERVVNGPEDPPSGS